MALYMLFTRISHLKKTNFLTSLPRGGYEKNWDLRRGGLPLRGGYPFVGVGMDPSRSYVTSGTYFEGYPITMCSKDFGYPLFLNINFTQGWE